MMTDLVERLERRERDLERHERRALPDEIQRTREVAQSLQARGCHYGALLAELSAQDKEHRLEELRCRRIGMKAPSPRRGLAGLREIR